jgi:hypothetical protein
MEESNEPSRGVDFVTACLISAACWGLPLLPAAFTEYLTTCGALIISAWLGLAVNVSAFILYTKHLQPKTDNVNRLIYGLMLLSHIAFVILFFFVVGLVLLGADEPVQAPPSNPSHDSFF